MVRFLWTKSSLLKAFYPIFTAKRSFGFLCALERLISQPWKIQHLSTVSTLEISPYYTDICFFSYRFAYPPRISIPNIKSALLTWKYRFNARTSKSMERFWIRFQNRTFTIVYRMFDKKALLKPDFPLKQPFYAPETGGSKTVTPGFDQTSCSLLILLNL